MAEGKCAMREGLRDEQTMSVPVKRTLTLICMACGSLVSGVRAQDTASTIIPVSPKPVGSGARALGQSAFIAVADDATAASWNPAGLINLEKPEVSFVGAWKSVENDYSAARPLVSVEPESWNDSEINFMSYAQPLQLWGRDVVLSVNYHQVYDFAAEFNRHEIIEASTQDLPGGIIVTVPAQVDEVKGNSRGAVSAYTLAGGLSIPDYPEVTIGVGINWYAESLHDNHAWQVKKTRTVTTVTEPPVGILDRTTMEAFDAFQAHNFTFGLLWDVYEKRENLLTFGLVCHTPFTATVDWKLDSTSTSGSSLHQPKESMDIYFPASLGAGVNYRLSDSLGVAFDVEWKEWSKFKQDYADGTQTSPVDDDILAYRLGGERLFIRGSNESLIACRGGVFYEPRPVTGYPRPVPVYGFSAGFGWTVMEQFSLDFAYQYRWGKEDLGNIDYEIKEDFFVLSLIRYF